MSSCACAPTGLRQSCLRVGRAARKRSPPCPDHGSEKLSTTFAMRYYSDIVSHLPLGRGAGGEGTGRRGRRLGKAASQPLLIGRADPAFMRRLREHGLRRRRARFIWPLMTHVRDPFPGARGRTRICRLEEAAARTSQPEIKRRVTQNWKLKQASPSIRKSKRRRKCQSANRKSQSPRRRGALFLG